MNREGEIHNYLFSKNRQKLVKRLPLHSLVIVVSNDEMPRSADQFFPFRQNSDLFYLTGITQPKTILCICPEHPDSHNHEILFIEKTTEYYQTWIGNKLSKEIATSISGVKQICWLDEFENILNDLMNFSRNIFLSYHETSRSFDEIPLRDTRYTEKIKNLFPLHHYERLSPIMASIRQIKEPEEIEQIKNAIAITNKAYDKIIQVLKPGIYEYQIEAEIIAEFIRNGGQGHAFQPIIAGGANACILHYIENKEQCQDNKLVLIDFGVEYNNYNSDVTRVLPVNGTFNKRQREVYMSVLRLHNNILKLIVPGNSIESLNQEIIPLFEEELINLKLFSKEDLKKQDPEKPLYKKYFMHGISHYLGLDVHDTGLKQESFTDGMIITCEPGIYIKDEEIGIRLENDILITHKGNINLTEKIPVEPDEIEEIMARRNRF